MMIKSGLWLAVAAVAFVVLCVGAGWIALQLIRGNRAAVMSILPLLAEQTIKVESPGELVVSIEVPRLSTEYRRWEFEILEHNTKQTHLMKWGGPRSTGAVTGVSTIKIPIGRLAITQSDQLTVRVKGLTSDVKTSAYQIILARPHLARMVLQIVGLVVCGVGALLSFILALWLMGIAKVS